MVILAAVATVIASQAAISGSFSVAKQAVQLGFLPRLTILHTSRMEGQIYVPVVNWALCTGVVALTLVFGSATKLGDVYGVAVTGTFILNTLLFLAVARWLWRTSRRKLAAIAALFLSTDAPGLRRWRKNLFVAMARNASSPIDHFGLPSHRTVVMGSQVAI